MNKLLNTFLVLLIACQAQSVFSLKLKADEAPALTFFQYWPLAMALICIVIFGYFVYRVSQTYLRPESGQVKSNVEEYFDAPTMTA